MPAATRHYVHCINCLCALERPKYRAIVSEIYYLDFALCEDCHKSTLAQECPTLTIQLGGDTMKTLLTAKSKEPLAFTIFEGTECPEKN